MPERFYKRLTRVLSSSLLLLPLWTQAQTDTWYRVEMLIFSTPAGSAAEAWEATPKLAYPKLTRFLADRGHPSVASPLSAPSQLTPFVTLPSSQREFRGAAARMQRNGRYRILFHQAWTQPIGSQSRAQPIVLDQSGDEGQWPALQGTIKLYVSRYLYLETNLWLNTNGEYLQSAWRMPPPPLGPPSSAADQFPQTGPEPLPVEPSLTPQVQAAQFDSQGISLDIAASGPEYPYRHAVLLNQTRRMRSREVNYIDHPMFGVVVKVTPLKIAEADSETGILSP